VGQRLDAAARISARTVRAAARGPIATQLRENIAFLRRVAGAAFTEAVSTPRGSGGPHEAPPHPGLERQPAAEFRPGDDEHCTCRSPSWCGATKGDVLHDLMTHGMRLDRQQAEAIWDEAQGARAD